MEATPNAYVDRGGSVRVRDGDYSNESVLRSILFYECHVPERRKLKHRVRLWCESI